MTDQSRLTWALVLSVLFHGMLLTLLPIWRRAHLEIPQPPALLDVDVVPLPKVAAKPVPPVAAAKPAAPAEAAKPAEQAPPPPPVLLQRQIVAPSDAGEEKAPENTRLLSDRDNTVKEEKVKRGDAPGGVEAKGESSAPHQADEKRERRAAARQPPAPAPEEHTRIAALPKLEQLLPHIGDFALLSSPPPTRPAAHAAENRNLLVARGSAFSSRPGSNDFLPTIREGDVTLLNTKAERFAPFVRRVFQHLQMSLEQAVRARGVVGGREFAVVEAVMNKQGQLVTARVVQRESNSNLAADRRLLETTKPDIFFDANPPPGAEASDGNIHFVLLVDLMVQSGVDPRSGVPGAGYSGIAGVGLDAEPKHD